MFKKKIKTLAALTVCCCLLTTQVAMAESAVVHAETKPAEKMVEPIKTDVKTKISMEEAKKIVKAFKFAEGLEVQNVYLENGNEYSQPIWRMDLLSSANYSNIQVSISANTGELVNYYSWQGGNTRKNIVSITKKQAKEAADNFIKEYIGTNGKTLEVTPDYNPSYEKASGIYEIPQYNFKYLLKINNVLVSDAEYYLSVNAVNGKVTSYYSPFANLTETKYPSADGVKDKDELKAKYVASLNMQLQYMTNYDNNVQKVYLAYLPVMPWMLDAKTLKQVSDFTYDYANGFTQTLKNNPIVPGAKVVNKEITEQEAEKTVLKIKTYLEKITGNKFIDNSSAYVPMSAASEETVKNYYFTAGENKNVNMSISISLTTGNITGLSYYQYEVVTGEKQKKVVEKVTYKDAKKVSDELIKNVFEKQYGIFSDNNQELQTALQYIKDQPSHQFGYIRFENGINTNNTISVGIDKETGKPNQIYINWSDIEFPKPQNIVSADKAKELYLKDAEFELAYYTPFIYKDGTTVKGPESVIIYKPSYSTLSKYIDAEKGTVIDFSGKLIQQRYVNENHWAAVNIEMLETQGIVLSNITNYDEKLTRQDAVKMLSLVSGISYYNGYENARSSFADITKDNEYFRYVEAAVANNIIQAAVKNFDGKQNITKQEFIAMLVNVLGYQDILNHTDLFVKTDSDIRITICKVLDILPVKPGETFNAGDEITFAEAAYSLQKALKYVR